MIRCALLRFLKSKKPEPRLLVEELNVHNGNAIIDVVAFYESIHGFEIKGETDKVSRVLKQSAYYNVVMPKLTLVTTENHLTWADRNLPYFWGIILVMENSDGPKLKYHRRAKANPEFSKEKSLLTLWKNELLNEAFHPSGVKVNKSDTRSMIAKKISKFLTKKQVIEMLSYSILKRKSLQAIDNKSQM